MTPVGKPLLSSLSIHQFNDILNFKTSELSQSRLHSFPLSTINQKCGQPDATPPMESAMQPTRNERAQMVIEELKTTHQLKSCVHNGGSKSKEMPLTCAYATGTDGHEVMGPLKSPKWGHEWLVKFETGYILLCKRQ